MASAVEVMSQDRLERMQRRSIVDPDEVRALLERVAREGLWLDNGIDRQINPRKARLLAIRDRDLLLETRHIDVERQPQLVFNFRLGDRSLFFATTIRGREGDRVVAARPTRVFEAERRDLPRTPLPEGHGDSVELEAGDTRLVGSVVDRSYDGLGVRARLSGPLARNQRFRLRFLTGPAAGSEYHSTLRSLAWSGPSEGWARLGLAVSKVPPSEPIPVERRRRILPEAPVQRAWRRLSLATSAASAAARTRLLPASGRRAAFEPPEVVRFANQRGQEMVGLLERVGGAGRGPLVLIPPAWGRTKETLMPLAAVLRETFRAHGLPASILRFDGTQRRGESWIDPPYREPGREYLGFRFSQAVQDIHAAVRFGLSEQVGAEEVVLLTFSLASIEGRRAAAENPTGRIAAWLSVVGMVDLHSGLRSASGGIDYAYGLERGVRFGLHEIAGVVADMDATGRDALEHRLGLLEDARRDMARIRFPVTWIHGRHDGWIELDRVRALMSAGPQERRRVIEVPTGHQLRSSQQAVETFMLVARELLATLGRRACEPAVPSPRALAAQRDWERARRPAAAEPDLKAFWRDYLLGRDRRLGIDLLGATNAYKTLVRDQVALVPGPAPRRILDLGSGTGDVSRALAERFPGAEVLAVDLVREAHLRARHKQGGPGDRCRQLVADLGVGDGLRFPLSDASVDCVVASLFLSYLRDPSRALAEMLRVLRPGGRLVCSVPVRDADVSKIYADGIREVRGLGVETLFGEEVAQRFERIQREFLSDGAKLLDLEERGHFSFFEADELTEALAAAGFVDVSTRPAFGDPPQVVLAAADKPRSVRGWPPR